MIKSKSDTFGDRLRKARVAAGITQAELAKQTGIGRGLNAANAIARLESNTKLPDIDGLEGVANVLNVDIHWLITGETTPNGESSEGSAQAFELLLPYVEAHLGEVARNITILEDDILMLRIHSDQTDEDDIEAVIERKQKLLRNELNYFEKVLNDIEAAKK